MGAANKGGVLQCNNVMCVTNYKLICISYTLPLHVSERGFTKQLYRAANQKGFIFNPYIKETSIHAQ